MPRKLTRDTQHGVVAGVAAGFGRYLDVDPVLARLGFVLLAFVNGLGVLVYLAGWALMPREDAPATKASQPKRHADRNHLRPGGDHRLLCLQPGFGDVCSQ